MTANLSRIGVVAFGVILTVPVMAQTQTARARYEAALEREQAVRQRIDTTMPAAPVAARADVLKEARRVIAAYTAIVLRHPVSGYTDNALWNAASLAESLYARYAEPEDKDTAKRLFEWLIREYPNSSFITRAEKKIANSATSESQAVPPKAPQRAILSSIERAVLPAGVRVTLSFDREVPYHEQRLDGPARLFFDLKGTQAASDLRDAVLRFPTDVVRQIRVGRHPDSVVRVVLDLEGVAKYSVFTLYNPFRLVIDAEPAPVTAAGVVPAPSASARAESPASYGEISPKRPPTSSGREGGLEQVSPPPPVAPVAPVAPERPSTSAPASSEVTPPVLPSVPNTAGGFSLSRQLGLRVSRVVIDPGHGGHDPGARAKGLNEADLTLDIALRLEALLQKEPGLEVVLTRRTNVYVPLEERTVIANREGADLFLSIHANASRNAATSGVETYFLSFASSPEAEAVAARENSASDREMHNLPDIVRAITLNNKLDESRDLAGMVQEALVTRLRRSNRTLRNLGVKKAPFVVLIGAEMPSVLAEVSFLTNRVDAQLLKTASYKQRIAEALHAAVLRYRRALKGQGKIAEH